MRLTARARGYLIMEVWPKGSCAMCESTDGVSDQSQDLFIVSFVVDSFATNRTEGLDLKNEDTVTVYHFDV